MDVIDLFAWCAFFSALAAAMLFGFHGMAHPRRSPLQEVASFACGLALGFCASAAISLLIVVELPGFLASTFFAGWATLLAAIPRIIHQSLSSQQFTIGFLLRLSLYSAMLFTLFRQYGDFSWLAIALAISVVAAGFHFLYWSCRYSGWQWLLILPLAWGTNFLFRLIDDVADPDPSWGLLNAHSFPWKWEPSVVHSGLGLALFYAWILAAKAVRFELVLRQAD